KLTIGDSRYILVEMPMGEVPRYAEDFLYHLKLKGFTPIIAHPERNRGIIENPNILARFIDLGSLTQINTGSISGFFGPKVQESARILITHNMGHVLGTDSHSNGRRGPYIKQAVENLYNWLDKNSADKIIYHNPETVLKGDILSVNLPIEYRPRKGIFSFFKRR
ncbi:MAG: CpsB/CapC family capsule biosynthesis tyrosine phosphatase, partial [Caldicoprobacterales bacterium]